MVVPSIYNFAMESETPLHRRTASAGRNTSAPTTTGDSASTPAPAFVDRPFTGQQGGAASSDAATLPERRDDVRGGQSISGGAA